MQTEHMKAALAVLWILAIGIAGYAFGTQSLAGWAALVAVALTPPLVIARFSGEPAKSTSESIQDVLR